MFRSPLLLILQLFIIRTTAKSTSLSCGYSHTCLIRASESSHGGPIECWGENLKGETNPPYGIFQQVTSGHMFSCALTMHSTVKCWGDIQNVPEKTKFQSITAGRMHVCGITISGEVHCFGRNEHGETVPPNKRFLYKQVACGYSNSCALTRDGFVECWGRMKGDSFPQTKLETISAKRERYCGIDMDGNVVCWGSSNREKCEDRQGQYLDVSVGVKEVCALHHNNTIDCWGAMQSVVPYNQTAEYHQISMGVDHACAIKLDGHVICWHNGPNYNLHEAPLGMALEF